MSCEQNRGKYLAHVAGAGSPAAQTFGGAAEAQAALETVFATARNQAPTATPAHQQMATAKTKLLFDQMQRVGIKPPTHSKDGLPKPDARIGYAALYDTLTALNQGKPLPALAAHLAQRGERQIQARRYDDALERFRCGTCGRFVARQVRAHLCPQTATPEALQRSLARRLGVPTGAYDLARLATLIDQAKGDGVRLRHPITGEEVTADLDALPLTITQGFVPQPWQGTSTLIALTDGRIAPVHDATGLTPVSIASGAIAQAAAHSGAPMPTGTPMVSSLTAPVISGGSTYDRNRFIGTEFRKGKGEQIIANGEKYVVGDRSHDPQDMARARQTGYASSPPTSGAFAGIAVGRTLVAATEILRTGSTVRRADGITEVYDADGGLVALYDPATRTAGDVDGTPNASAAQMAAVIADLVWRGYTPAPASGPEHTELQAYLHLDVWDLQHADPTRTPLGVSDSAYLAITELIETHGTLTLGASLTATRCPECGRFMGADGCHAAHARPATPPAPPAAAVAIPTVPPSAATSVEAPAVPPPVVPLPTSVVMPPIQVTVEAPAVTVEAPQVTVEAPTVAVEAPQVTVAAPTIAVEAPTVQVNVAAPQVTVEAPQIRVDAPQIVMPPPPITVSAPMSMPTPVAVADGSTVVSTPAPTDPRLVEAIERMAGVQAQLAETLTRVLTTPTTTPAAPPPAPTAAPTVPASRPPLRPRRDRAVPDAKAMTEQEKIVNGIRVPRPDRELTAIDPKLLPTGFQAIEEEIPAVNTSYVLNAAAKQVLNRIVNTRKAGLAMNRVNNTRAFGIYGPPGTGKNELAKQLAASMITVDAQGNERQGVHYEQVEFDKDMDIAALIGTTTLENGSTVARLGPVGLAAVQGSVICLNEVVRNAKAMTAFQSMLEEGEVRLKTPEGGIVSIPIHPATTFIMTWNPGMEGDPDRPAGAPLARMVAMELPAPTMQEQVSRTMKFFDHAPAEYQPTKEETQAAIQFMNLVATGIQKGDIQQRGRGSKSVPGPREITNFVLAGKTDGWLGALEQLKIYGDQNIEDRDKDWKFIKEQFTTVFGSDGQAIARKQAGAAPTVR